MTGTPATVVERFWCSRDGSFALDQSGFLRDPDLVFVGGQSANPGVLRTEDLRLPRCLVLLGEPGAGKSASLMNAARLLPPNAPILRFDLAVYGSEDRLVREAFEGAELRRWAEGTGELGLVLDSLDEARARLPTIGAVISDCVGRLPHERLNLRIACRTADWLPGLEESLKRTFGSVTAVEILPLRRVDAAEIASGFCEPDAFLDAVTQMNAGPLAARPLTLRLLAGEFGRSGSLPSRSTDLYALGIRSLCEEQSLTRLDSGLRGTLQLDQRVDTARRIAAATVFGGVAAVYTGPEFSAGRDDIPVEALLVADPDDLSGPDGSRDAVLEVLRTGLFSSRGDQRLGWAHATFADFLAAEWVALHLAPEQSRPLLLGPDGLCWPQTRLAAAWVMAIAPEQFGFLAREDPGAFQGEVEIPGDGLRATIVEGLFGAARALTTAPWERAYRGLRHPGISDQVRPNLRSSDPDVRYLALELADECAAIELRDELVSIALDDTAGIRDRVMAGRTLARLPGPYRTAALRPLALEDAVRQGDEFDQLKGVGLLASWPHGLSTSEVFAVLTPAKRRNFHGAYETFLERFRADLTAEDLGEGLKWLEDLSGPSEDPDLGAVANRLFELAAGCPTDPAVVDSLARLVLRRADEHEGLFFRDFRNDHGDPLSDEDLRRSVILAVLATNPPDHVLYRLPDRSYDSLGVVRSDDLAWLAEAYASKPDLRGSLRSLFDWTYDLYNSDHREFALGMSSSHPLHRDLVHTWTDAIVIASPEAEELRRSWEQIHGRRPGAGAAEEDRVDEWITDLLDRFDEGDEIGFWQAVRLLSVPPNTSRYVDEFNPDIAGRPRWAALPATVQVRLTVSAERYLREHPCRPEEWLRNPSIRYFPAEAGYRAMLLLLHVAPSRLDLLPHEAWMEWAPVLAAERTGFINGATLADKVRLLEHAGPGVLDAVREALATRIEAAVSEGAAPMAENEAGLLWDSTLADLYLALMPGAGPEPREELATTLAKRDVNQLRLQLQAWLGDASDDERQVLAAQLLFEHDLEVSWLALRVQFETNIALAEAAIGRVLHVRGLDRFDDVSDETLADLYSWLRASYPPKADPEFDDAHIVGTREQMGRSRDDLLARIRDRGTADSVRAIRTISEAFPDDRSLVRTLTHAEASLRRRQWSPTSLPNLLRLASNHRSLVVNDAKTLSNALVAALTDIQVRLTGATPESHYLWDSHSHRPKSEDEISDYLANTLTRTLKDLGVVVNREVQIRRSRQSGIGERTDLLAEALVTSDESRERILVPIEVKGAWNGEVSTAMTQQLADRYMRDVRSASGIYAIVWPDLASWTDATDSRRAAVASLSMSSIVSGLEREAEGLAAEGLEVEVVHLDISYRRPERVTP